MSTSALTDAIYQNTAGNSQGYPLGVPTSWSWYSGTDTVTGNTPPSNFSAVTGWGQVYPQAGAPADSNPSASVQIANFQTYVHLTSGAWVLVQDQSTDPISGAHFLADFSGNSTVAWNETTLSDGSVSVDAPQNGYNDHLWPGARGTYAPGTVDGVFVEASMKTDDPNKNLVANLGADWWLNSSASYVNGFSNNPGAGMSDWVKLTTQWQSLYFTSLSPQQLQADPPPGLETASPPVTTPSPPVTTPSPPATMPAVTQVVASPTSGIENVGKTITLTLDLNEAVMVTGTPTLTLNDGGTATYQGGSGTSALTFSYTVGATDTSTSALAVTAVNLPSGANVKDAAGTAADLSGAMTTLTGLQVDTTPPPVTQPPATQPSVTGVVASPSTGIEFPGDTISLTLKFNEAVTVRGEPTLSLNDGGTATYTGGSGTDTLTFTDTVQSSDQTVSALAVTAVNLPHHAAIKDAAGTAADLSGALTTFSGLGIDPPTSAASDHPTNKDPAATAADLSGTPTTSAGLGVDPTTPEAPTVSIKNPSLSVPAHGKIDLGLSVTAPDSADASVTISGLPRYEAITDNLDHKTFHGSSITLSEAEVDSGLTLQSNSWHSGDPATTLTVTAHDSTAGGSATSAARTITVTNPTMSSFALLNQHLAGDFNGNTGQGEITSHSSWAHNDWVLANSSH